MSERRIPAFVGLAAGTALVVASSLCLAQTPADPAAQALALFKEGVELRKQGKCAEALPKLAESVRLRTTAGTLLNVALCEESVGRLAAALQHYREVQVLLTKEDERMTLVSTHIGDLEPRVPRLRVSLSRAATDARVSVDGQRRSRRRVCQWWGLQDRLM